MKDDKEKKGKKKAKDKKAKSNEEIEKAEKAEKAKKEKDKKKKEKKKKEGGLNLEDQEFRVGIKMKYKLHYEDLGTKAPDIICEWPSILSQCNMVETSSTCKRQLENSILFCIAVLESAGRGKLIVAVRSAGTNKRLHGILTTAMLK